MTSVSFSGSTIVIDGNEIELSESVFDVLTTDDAILVVFDPGEMDPRNLVAYDHDGNRLWRVQQLTDPTDGTPISVNWIKEVEDGIVAFTGTHRFEIDTRTGEAEHLGWYR